MSKFKLNPKCNFVKKIKRIFFKRNFPRASNTAMMDKFETDQEKPLWWILLVISLMVFIYCIGVLSHQVDYNSDGDSNVVESQSDVYR